MPLVSVITAAHNAEAFIVDALDSIREQTLGDWEHVVVDDASTDATADLVAERAATDPRVKLLRLADNVGPFAAANAALATVDSRFVARLDADDLALPRRLEAQVTRLEESAAAVGCTGAWQALSSRGVDPLVRPAPTALNGALAWRLWLRNGMPHSTLMIESGTLRRWGGYGGERVGEDLRIWSRLALSRSLVVVSEPVALWRQSEGQITAAAGARDDPARLRLRLAHMRDCDPGGEWSLDDARDLRYLGRPAPFPVRRAMGLLERWESAWRADGSLGAADRRDLSHYARHVQTRHVRHNAASLRDAWHGVISLPSLYGRHAWRAIASR